MKINGKGSKVPVGKTCMFATRLRAWEKLFYSTYDSVS
jgi:hypothetical protein